MRTTTAALTLAAVLALPAGAQAYSDDLDPTFGTDGRGAIAAGNENTAVDDALQHDGKVVVAGQARHNGDARFFVARFNVSGTADATFGSGGARMVDASPGMTDGAHAIARQADGRYVVAGFSDVSIAGQTQHRVTLIRFNADGSLDDGTAGDSTPGDEYGTNGIVHWLPAGASSASAMRMVLDADGRAVVLASTSGNNVFQRFSTTGAPSGATVNAPAGLGADDELVRSGGDYYAVKDNGIGVLKITSSFQAASGWGTNGRVTFPGTTNGWSANTIDVAPDGDLVIAGSNYGSNAMMTARVNANGTIDTTYGGQGTGIAILDLGKQAQYFQGITVMPNGRIVLSGYLQDDRWKVVVTRLLADGTPDASFGPMGSVIAGARPQDTKGAWGSTPFVDGNGRILVAATASETSGTQRALAMRFQGGSTPRHSGKVQITPEQAPLVGDTLTCDTGAFAGAPALQYQWYRNSGQTLGTTATHKVTAAQFNQVLWCDIVASYGNDLRSATLVTPLTAAVANPPLPAKPVVSAQTTTPKPVVQQPATSAQQQGTTTGGTVVPRPTFGYRLGALKVRRHRLQVKLTLPSAGAVRIVGRSGRTTVFVVSKRLNAGTRTLSIGLNAKGRKILRTKGRVRVKLAISAASNAGVPGSTIRTAITVK